MIVILGPLRSPIGEDCWTVRLAKGCAMFEHMFAPAVRRGVRCSWIGWNDW